jgi:TrmH family RNA methyltransferase
MIAKQIKSLQHPIVKHIVCLRENTKYRREKNKAVVFGYKIVQELAKKQLISSLLLTNETKPIEIKTKEKIIFSAAIMKKISGLKNPEPIGAIIDLPKQKDLSKKKRLLVLDHISDPGNMGTIIRSAYALGWEGIILMPNCVDLFNDKVIRASKGCCFYFPHMYCLTEEIKMMIEKHSFNVFIADIKGKSLEKQIFAPPLLLILSNESSGVNSWEDYTHITIPIEKINSLNVAIAGGICMYSIKRSLYEK